MSGRDRCRPTDDLRSGSHAQIQRQRFDCPKTALRAFVTGKPASGLARQIRMLLHPPKNNVALQRWSLLPKAFATPIVSQIASKPAMVSSATSSRRSAPDPTYLHREFYYRLGYDPASSQCPQLFYDTADESDYEPTGLLTPVSIDSEYERECEGARERYLQKQRGLREWAERAKKIEAELAERKARSGVYMRTRAGIFRNEKDLDGWDGVFCYLDSRGRMEISESVWAYVMVSEPDLAK